MSACPTVSLTPLERRLVATVARLGPAATDLRVAEALGRRRCDVVLIWLKLRALGLALPPPQAEGRARADELEAAQEAAEEADPLWRAAVGRRIAALRRRKKARGDPDPWRWYAEAPDPVLSLEPAAACRAMLAEWKGTTP